MIKIENINYHKDQGALKLPLFYTDENKNGLWLAMRLPKRESAGILSNTIAVLNMIDREGKEVKGNSVFYTTLEQLEEKHLKREILEKDVLIQY